MLTNLTTSGKTVTGVFALIGGTISSFFGGFDLFLKILVGFMVIDYISGVSIAAIKSELNSGIGFKGILKKLMILALVCMGYGLDIILQTEMVRNLVIFFYIGNEGISIIENASKLGVKVPPIIVDELDKLKNDKKE